MLYTIYVLIDPRDNQVRYVGATNNPTQRLKSHLLTKDDNQAKRNWFAELALYGQKPTLEEIEVTDDEEVANQRETYWIIHYIRSGANLTNTFSKYRPKRAPTPKRAVICNPPKIVQIAQKEYIREKSCYSPEEVAEYYDVTADTIRRLCREGKIPGAKQIGKQWRIPREYLQSTSTLPKPDEKKDQD